MIRTKFFEDPNGGYAKVSDQKRFDRVWKNVLDFEKKTGLSLDNGLTKEEYVSIFNSMKIRRTTSTFMVYKGCVMAYVHYLVANKALPPEQESILASVNSDDLIICKDGSGVQYYKNLGMLRSAIQDSVRSSESYDETKYDVPVVSLYLAWYGLSEQEIVEYPKANVLDDGIIIHDKKLQIPFDILQIFTRLRDAEGYYQQARGVILRKYVYSDYLIRSKQYAQLPVVLLRSIVSRFNAICGNVYSLTYNVVYDSGVFNRVYRLECDGFQLDLENPEVASKIFCEDLSNNRRAHVARIRDYSLYKQLYN